MRTDGEVRIGAGMTYRDLLDPPFAQIVPALAHAARTVGSPQIRNAGTIGGNLATASPAGDTLPVLAALDARIERAPVPAALAALPLSEFIVGPEAQRPAARRVHRRRARAAAARRRPGVT